MSVAVCPSCKSCLHVEAKQEAQGWSVSCAKCPKERVVAKTRHEAFGKWWDRSGKILGKGVEP